MRHFQNMSYDQIAEALFCNKGTVTSRLYYARKRLEELLGARGPRGDMSLLGTPAKRNISRSEGPLGTEKGGFIHDMP